MPARSTATGPVPVAVSVAVGLGLLLTACSSDDASDHGEAIARRSANDLAATFTTVLSRSTTEAEAITGLRAAIDARKAAHHDSESNWFALDGTSTPGRAEATVAIYAHGEGTQGFVPNSQAVVLLCVKVSGTPTATARADLTVVTCPPNLPSEAPRPVDRTVRPEP